MATATQTWSTCNPLPRLQLTPAAAGPDDSGPDDSGPDDSGAGSSRAGTAASARRGACTAGARAYRLCALFEP